MLKWILLILAAGLLLQAFSASQAAPAEDKTLLDPMDAVSFTASSDKAHVAPVPGRSVGALQFSFANDCMNVFCQGRVSGKPEWDGAAGISFWVKGDGSNHLGGLEFIWNGDYSQRYGYAFPINSTAWRKVVVPWRDLIPETSGIAQAIDPQGGHAPSKLGPITFGKWWYWKDYAAHSYTVDDIRLEPVIPPDKREYRPSGDPLARVRAKLKAGKPITIVTMGDSLTDFSHWTNHETNWPTQLTAQIRQKHGSQVILVNPAMGGTELRQNLVVLPRWASVTPRPDLVTIFFGFNDWTAGMRQERFTAVQQDAIDRVRRATGGRADMLIMTPCPPLTLNNGEALGELAAACRQAARSRNAGLCDVYADFQAVPLADRPPLHAPDGVHLSPLGQQRVAQSVLKALEGTGK